jgi:hypothetical protein
MLQTEYEINAFYTVPAHFRQSFKYGVSHKSHAIG